MNLKGSLTKHFEKNNRGRGNWGFVGLKGDAIDLCF
jgi:hypothetical protein